MIAETILGKMTSVFFVRTGVHKKLRCILSQEHIPPITKIQVKNFS